jgi:hypothetical protein
MLSLSLLSGFGVPLTAHSEGLRFNNDNWHTLPHPRVAEFYVKEDGSVLGITETGVSFVQYTIPNEYDIQVQRFEMEDHYHYVVDGEIADSFTELSILLAEAYERTLPG